MLRRLCWLVAILAVVGCDRQPAKKNTTVASKLDLSETQAGDTDYLVKFSSAQEASAHINQVQANGGDARLLSGSETIVKVKASNEVVRQLSLSEDADAVINSTVSIQARAQTELPSSDELADAVLTAKRVVGVDRLRARAVNATGAGVKVAVFDTGIDFGLLGVSDGEGANRKLLGFYDMTNFGRRQISETDPHTLKFSESLAQPQQYVGEGTLNEAELAREYLTPTIDLDGNGRFDDEFVYAVVVNGEGESAVWIDLNRDGEISDLANEQMRDFNTTGDFVTLRPEVAPSGARPLAVTFHSLTDIQFHSVPGGHGTSCAIVIGGKDYANGTLNGMAPEVQFLSYTLDVTGQDVYTVDQFIEMFLHAKAQQVDAISISWGFTVANLQSARFMANFLDEEIASQGIIIGIAAGNEGPAVGSGNSVDYMPVNGFAVGAMSSEDQARNVYGWNGDFADSVIWYSSFGPTRGGRQIPDVISPLMTMIRGERATGGQIWRGFGGTSSATPALIGAVAAMMSQLKAEQIPINARLIKLAVQNAAAPLESVMSIRQGAGVLDIDRAYDIYRDLYAELAAAQNSASKSKPHAYEINVSTADGAGLVLDSYRGSARVALSLSDASAALVDPLTFAEPLKVEHSSSFFSTNDVVLMQASGAQFSVAFDADALRTPGLYQDTIRLVSSRSGQTLARIPVVARIADRIAADQYNVASINTVLSMEDQHRSFIDLAEPSALEFEGVAVDAQGGFGTYIGFYIATPQGDKVFDSIQGVQEAVTSFDLKTPVLAAGHYEIVVFRGGSRPAVVRPLTVTGAWHKPSLSSIVAEVRGDTLDILLQARSPVGAVSAELVLNKEVRTVALTRDESLSRPGYYGEIELAAAKSADVVIYQDRIDTQVDEFLHVSLAMIDISDQSVLYRGWIEFHGATSPAQSVTLTGDAANVGILAYPNIVDWDSVRTQTLQAQIALPIDAMTLTTELATPATREPVLSFRGEGMPAHAKGTLRLLDGSGKEIESLEVQY